MEIFLAMAGLTASFYFAGAEAAYTAFSKIRLEVWKKQKKKFIASALYFHKKPEDFFSTILIGNNFANILYSTFATVVFIHFFDKTVSWVFVTLIVLFFGEIFPKTLFRSLSDILILPVLSLARLFYFLFKPLIRFINALMELILKFLRITHRPMMDYFSRDELELMINASLHQQNKQQSEQKYIKNVLEFSTSNVREAMTPRTELISMSSDSTYHELLEAMIENQGKALMIYQDSPDNITGVLFCKDLLRVSSSDSLPIRPLALVPENKSCASLLQEFQQSKQSIALVVDEFGGTAGVVTIDELIEEVFGEFYLPGEVSPEIRALNKFTWLVDARAEIEIISEKLGIEFKQGDYETIAGFLLDFLGRIPKPKERIRFDDYHIEIVKSSPKKILQVKIIKKP